MSDKIDQRIVEMSFENHKFEKGISESSSSLKEFSNALKNMDTGNNFNGLERSLGTISGSFSVFEQVAVGALRRVGEMAVNTGASLVKSLSIDQLTAGLSKYQEKIEAVQTMVSAGYGLDEVERTMQQLMWFSDETSYSFSDMASNMGKFVSAGVDLKTSSKAMQGIATWAAHSGKNSQAASIAMFNLSQAISLGYVDTMNWRSIMNQNMNTVMFKQIAIGVAEATGAIKKGQVTIQDFDANLKDKWFTNDVLLKTLEQYSAYAEKVKEVQEEMNFDTAAQAMEYMGQNSEKYADVLGQIGNAAFKAAQESKSFADSINATKDAVSSGWMRTYEIIFGTLDEAKKNFSQLTEILYTTFAAGADSRNEILQSIKDAGGIKDAFQSIKNLSVALLKPLKAVSKAFDQIFPPKTADKWVEIIKNIKDFTGSLIISDSTTNKIQRTFAGFFAILDIGWQGVKLFGSAMLEVVKIFVPFNGGILELSASLGDFLVYVDRAIKSSGFFQYALLAVKVAASIVRNILHSTISEISKFATGLWTAEQPLKFIGETANKIFSGITQNVKMAAEWISTSFMSTLEAVQTFLSDKLGPESTGIFSDILAILKDGIDYIINVATGGLKNFGNVIKDIDFNKIASFVTAGVLLLFVNQLTNLTKTINDFVVATTSFVTKLSKKLFGTTTKLKDLALVIGTLSASLWVLSTIPWENLKRGLTGLAGAIGLFVAAYAGIQTVAVIATKVLKGQAMAKTAFELIALAGGLAIMAAALKKISDIKTDNIGRAVGVVFALMTFLASYQVVMAVASKIADGGKLSSSILGMASGLLLIIGTIKILNGISDSEINSGFSKITSMLIVLGSVQLLFSTAAKIGGGNKLSTSILGMATGVLILVGVIKIIDGINPDEIIKGMLKISFILSIIAAVQVLFSLAANVGGGAKASTNIIGMAGGVAAMMVLIKLVNLMTPDEIMEGAFKITFMMGMLAAIQAMFALAGNIGGGKVAGNILSATVAITVMTGLIRIINFYTPDQINQGISTLLKMAAIIGVIQMVSGLASAMGGGNKASASLLSTTMLVAAMGGVIAMLSIIPVESLQAASTAMLNGAVAIGGLILALSAFSYTAQDSVGKMLGLATSLVIFGAAIALISLPLIELSKLDTAGLFAGVGALSVLIGLFAGMSALFDSLGVGTSSLLGLAAALGVFAAALTLMSVPMLIVSSIDGTQLGYTVAAFAGLLAVFALIGFMDGKSGALSSGMFSAAAGVAAFGAALIVVTGAIALAGVGLKLGAEAIDILIGAFGKLVTIVRQNKDTLVDDFTVLGTAIASGIFAGIATFFGKIGEALAAVWNKIIVSIKSFFGIHSPSTVMAEIGLNISQGLLNGIVSGAKDVINAAKNIANKVVDTVKGVFDTHSPSKVFNTIGGWCTKGLAVGISSETKSATTAASTMALQTEEAVRNALGVHSLSEKWKGIGEWLPKSLASGMEENKDWLTNAATDLGIDTGNCTLEGLKDSITNGDGAITTALGGLIDILSGGSTDLGESVGKNVATGAQDSLSDPINGLGGSKTKGVIKSELEKLKDALEEEKFYGRLNLDQELKAYENFRKTVKLSAEDQKSVDKEIYQLNKAIYDAQTSYIDGVSNARKEANAKRRSQEEQYQNDITSIEKNAEAERAKLREDYVKNQLSINEKLLSDIDAQNKAYEDAVKSRADSIYNSYSLFAAVEKDSDVTGAELLQNLRDQGAALSDWQQSLDTLAARGISEALIGELQEMGPSSKAQIKALISLTDEQLDEYVRLFEGKYAFARIKAETELVQLKDNSTLKIQELIAQSGIDLDGLEVEFSTSMDNVNSQMEQDLSDLKETHRKAMREINQELSSNLGNLADTFNSAMNNVTGLTETQYNDLIAQNNLKMSAINQNTAGSMGKLEGIYANSGSKIISNFGSNLDTLNTKSNANLSTLNSNTGKQLSTMQTNFKTTGDQVVLRSSIDGQQIVNNASKNMDELNSQTKDGLNTLGENISDELDGIVDEFETAGYNASSGFARGIERGLYLTIAAAKNMATTAKEAAEKVLDEHSPSKVFEQIGQFVSKGFANGIIGYSDQVERASSSLANGPISIISKAISELELLMDDDTLWSPVVTPVLDLSNIRSNRIADLLGGSSYSLASRSINLAGDVTQNGSREVSQPAPAIINKFDMTGLVVRSEADINAISTKLYQKQQAALRGRGVRLAPSR